MSEISKLAQNFAAVKKILFSLCRNLYSYVYDVCWLF